MRIEEPSLVAVGALSHQEVCDWGTAYFFFFYLIALSYHGLLRWTTAHSWVDVTEWDRRPNSSRRGYWTLHESRLPLEELTSLLDLPSAAGPAHRTTIKTSPVVWTTVGYYLPLRTAPTRTQWGCDPLSFHCHRNGGTIGTWGKCVGR